MATNLEMDEALVLRAMQVSGIRTKRALVDEALRALIRQHEQREVRDLRGRLHWGDPPAGSKGKRGA
jgi:Arc/MetJ family transcription regulator